MHMLNIFRLDMPTCLQGMQRQWSTITFDRIAPHVSPTLGRKLQQVFGPHPIAV